MVALSRLQAPLNGLLVALGLLCVAVLSVPDLPELQRQAFGLTLVGIWALYVVQLAATAMSRRASRDDGWMTTFVVDLLAVALPLGALFSRLGVRDQSLFCCIWILKPLRHSPAVRLVTTVLVNEGRNLLGVMSLFAILLFVASLGAYVIERDAQPAAFGSIPKAMWWGVVTLSTTGYGDEIPQTLPGRILAGFVMMGGIGVFALWAGLLASGFSEELRRQDFVRKWQLVSTVPLFRQLGSSELVGIVRALRPGKAAAGSVICRKGEAGDRMFFIVDGSVEVAAAHAVRLGPGSFFGEMALITGEPRSATVTAATAVSLMSLSATDFQFLLSHNPDIADAIRKVALERRATG